MSGCRIAVGASTAPDPTAAAREACAQALSGLGGRRPTILLAFASPELWIEGDRLAASLAAAGAAEHSAGAMSDTIIAGGREIADGPALAVWMADLPDTIVGVRHLRAEERGEGVAITPLDLSPADIRAPTIVLADPFTFPTDVLLEDLGARGLSAVGGLTSGGRRPGEHRLLADGRVVDEGAVVVTMSGVSARAVVSQGCAPIGPEMVVTDAEGTLVRELAGAPALARIEGIVASLSPDDRRRAASGMLAGLVIDENRPDYGIGDYLMRGILGADQDTGELIVGERVRIGQTLRFHVRDAEIADRDLRERLRDAGDALGDATIAGALVFSCNGRGRHMFATDDHDASTVLAELGDVPLAGMFCNGEIGPVGSRNFLHGFTATLSVFYRERHI